MPTYEYRCQKCDHRFEVFQSMKDDRLTDCPLDECDGNVVRLIGTGAGIIFKGSGFYQTDYRSDSYNKAAKADTGSGPTSSASESKPATKSESSASPSSTSGDK